MPPGFKGLHSVERRSEEGGAGGGGILFSAVDASGLIGMLLEGRREDGFFLFFIKSPPVWSPWSSMTQPPASPQSEHLEAGVQHG